MAAGLGALSGATLAAGATSPMALFSSNRRLFEQLLEYRPAGCPPGHLLSAPQPPCRACRTRRFRRRQGGPPSGRQEVGGRSPWYSVFGVYQQLCNWSGPSCDHAVTSAISSNEPSTISSLSASQSSRKWRHARPAFHGGTPISSCVSVPPCFQHACPSAISGLMARVACLLVRPTRPPCLP